MTRTMGEALEAVGLDRPVDPGHWQPHEVPVGCDPPPSLADAGLDHDGIVPGLVALRMDPLLLLRDDRVDTPTGRDRLGIGLFLCLEVTEDGGRTSWAALTDKEGTGRLVIEPAWRGGGNSKWRNRQLFLLDADELWVGPKPAFVAAAWREALSDLEQAHLTDDGLEAVRARVAGDRHPGSIPVDWEALARASTHPLQVSILEVLGMDGGRTLSPSNLSHELQVPVTKLSYHIGALKKSVLVILTETEVTGGVVEHFYRPPEDSVECPTFDWEGLARARAHPVRISILEILGMDGGRILSPNELAYELQIPLGNIGHHVRMLATARLIVLAGTHKVRGATEHFYRLPTAPAGAPQIER